jgi:hypothetical protein
MFMGFGRSWWCTRVGSAREKILHSEKNRHEKCSIFIFLPFCFLSRIVFAKSCYVIIASLIFHCKLFSVTRLVKNHFLLLD